MRKRNWRPGTRTKKPYNEYAWTKMYRRFDEEWGQVYWIGDTKPDNVHLCFRKKQKGWCGFDLDRNRFICQNRHKRTPIIRGTWYHKLIYGG